MQSIQSPFGTVDVILGVAADTAIAASLTSPVQFAELRISDMTWVSHVQPGLEVQRHAAVSTEGGALFMALPDATVGGLVLRTGPLRVAAIAPPPTRTMLPGLAYVPPHVFVIGGSVGADATDLAYAYSERDDEWREVARAPRPSMNARVLRTGDILTVATDVRIGTRADLSVLQYTLDRGSWAVKTPEWSSKLTRPAGHFVGWAEAVQGPDAEIYLFLGEHPTPTVGLPIRWWTTFDAMRGSFGDLTPAPSLHQPFFGPVAALIDPATILYGATGRTNPMTWTAGGRWTQGPAVGHLIGSPPYLLPRAVCRSADGSVLMAVNDRVLKIQAHDLPIRPASVQDRR